MQRHKKPVSDIHYSIHTFKLKLQLWEIVTFREYSATSNIKWQSANAIIIYSNPIQYSQLFQTSQGSNKTVTCARLFKAAAAQSLFPLQYNSPRDFQHQEADIPTLLIKVLIPLL